jgi:acyl carrier protein
MTEFGPAGIEPTPENIRVWLVERVARYLDTPADAVDPDASLADFGLDSVYAFSLCGEIEDTLDVAVEPTLIWDVENLVDLTDRIVDLVAARTAP